MDNAKKTSASRRRRTMRVRRTTRASVRPRLHVFRSSKHISAQLIDDENGRTVAAASSCEKSLRSSEGTKSELATRVGSLIAERGKEAGVDKVVFDRGPYKFHGRIKALAQAARDGGLQF